MFLEILRFSLQFIIYAALAYLLILFMKKYVKKNRYLILVLFSLLLFVIWIFFNWILLQYVIPGISE